MPRKFRLGLTNFCQPTQKETLWKTSLLPDHLYVAGNHLDCSNKGLFYGHFSSALHKRFGGSCHCDRCGMENAVYQCPGTCECSGGPRQTCILQFCNLPQYFTSETKVSQKKASGNGIIASGIF